MALRPVVENGPKKIHIGAGGGLRIVEVVRLKFNSLSNSIVKRHIVKECLSLFHRFRQVLYRKS